MKSLKIFLCFCLSALILFSFIGCKKNNTDNDAENGTNSEIKVETADTSEMDFEFTDRELSADFDENSATIIAVSGSTAQISGTGAAYSGSEIKITKEGTYVLSGTGQNLTVKISVGDNEKVQLVLDNLSISNNSAPCIYVAEGDKVFITAKDGTKNSLSDGNSYSLTDGDTVIDAAVFSRTDLCINGGGALSISGNYKHAVISKDDLVVTGGKITVKSKNVGLGGKDCVKITNANITVNSGSDALRSDNEEDVNRGYIYIKDSTFDIVAANDAVQAHTVLKIDTAKFKAVCGGGSNNRLLSSSESYKGLKAGSDIIISGGMFDIDSADDTIHSNNTICIESGSFSLSSGDDGIHADTDLSVNDGNIVITKSYEGIEASKIVVLGGNIDVTASDDGFNAAGGNDTTTPDDSPFGRPGKGGFTRTTGEIQIRGGYIVVDALGDGIDSNGTINVSGGTVLVSGPTNNGNGSIDCESEATVSGGVVVALGSSGMAGNFTNSENQGSMLCNFTSQAAGTSFAVCDENGTVIASFTPQKTYQSAVCTSPDIQKGKTYTLVAGGVVKNADKYGFAQSSTISGGETLATVNMTSEIYGSSGGMGMPGGHGGGGMQMPGGHGGMRW